MSLQRTTWAATAYVELAGEADANRDVYRVRKWLRESETCVGEARKRRGWQGQAWRT